MRQPVTEVFKSKFAVTLAICTTCFSSVADAADDTISPSSLGEIVVTAEKRDTTVQRSGLSITAIRGSDLLAAGVTDIQGIATSVPGVSFRTGGPGQTELEMRGLNSGGGNSPTVGFYLDETPLTSFAFATSGKVVIDPNLYDLDRVEVLRGPQGTLYGSSSMGGTIKLLTHQPVLNQFQASTQLEGSDTEGGSLNGSANAMINIPIAQDKAALRVVVTKKYLDGWIDRVVLKPFPPSSDPSGIGFGTIRGNVEAAPVAKVVHDVNSNQLLGARATLLVQPTDALSITPMLMYQRITTSGQSLIDADQTSTTLTTPNNAVYRVLGAQFQPNDTPEPVHDEFKLANLTMKYDAGFAQFVSATAWWKRTLDQVQDGSEVMQYVLQTPSYYTDAGGLGSGPWIEVDSARQFSQELRVASSGSSPLQWLIGGYYSRLRSVQHQFANYTDPAAVANFANIDPLAIDAHGKATSLDQTVDQNIRQAAIFGEISYEMSSQLKFTAGLRYFNFNSVADTGEFGLFAPAGDLNPSLHRILEKDNGFNPKFNATWRPSPDLTVYGTIAKGFRPGGTNQVIPTNGVAEGGTPEGDACKASLSSLGRANNPTSYEPDSVWSYEVGEKTRLFHERVTVNAAAYYQKWSNIQRSVTLGCAFIFSDNAGSAESYGSELEVNVDVSKDFRVAVNAGYTHATYTSVNKLPSLDGSGLVSRTGVLVGEKLPDVPEFTSTQSLIYSTLISSHLTATGSLMNSYIGSREETTSAFTNGSGNSNIPVGLEAYDELGIRAGVRSDVGWGATLFVENVTNNQKPISAINSQVLNITPVRRLTIDRPRTYGVSFTYDY